MTKYKNFAFITAILIAVLFFVGTWAIPAGANTAEISLPQATGTPTAQPNTSDTTVSAEQEAVKSVIQAYFELRYRAFNTLQMDGFGDLVSSSPDARAFLDSELGKLGVEIRHAKLNHLRYVKYEYFLNFKEISIDAAAQTAVVSVVEGHDVIYEISEEINPVEPIVSSMQNLEHKIILQEEQGKWKIVSDDYEDYLWRMLRQTGISTDELLRSTNIQQSSTQNNMNIPSAVLSLPDDASTHAYDWDGAVSYAHKYATNPNPNYFYFTGEVYGGDCTNFVSQAIYEGGNASMAYSVDEGIGTVGWYYTDVNHRASAWVDVTKLHEFITQYWVWPEGPEGSEVSQTEASPGDLIQMDWTNDGVWDHSVIIVLSEDDGLGNRLHWVAGHSDDVDNEPFTTYITDNPNMVYRFIKIERIDISAPRGFDSNGILASYYNDQDDGQWQLDEPITWDTFTDFVLSRFEQYIAFDTGANSPAPGVNGTFWSATWDGTLHVPQDGNYTLYFKNLDDGVRIYVDNTMLLESWLVQGFHNYQSTPIPLNAGPHIIRVEFAQGPPDGGGLIIEWSLEDVFREKNGPYSGVTSTPTATPTATATSTLIPTPTLPPLPTATSTPPPTPKPTAGPWGQWIAAEEAALQSEPLEVRDGYSSLLSRVRDEVMISNPKGEAYIRLVYRYAPELTAMLLTDASLRQETRTLMMEVHPLLEEMLTGKGDAARLSADWVKRTLALLKRVDKKASPELKWEIIWWRAWLPRFAGKNGMEIWEMLPPREIDKMPETEGSPEEMVLQSLSPTDARQFGHLLSRVRDEVMRPQKGGEVYVTLVYRYTPEVVSILLGDETMRKEAEALLLEAKPGLEALLDEQSATWNFSESWVQRMDSLLGKLAEKGSPELRAEVKWWQVKLNEWAGKTPQSVWESLLRESR